MPCLELDIAGVFGARFRFAELNEAFGQIDRDNPSLRPDRFSGGQGRSAASSANIENRLTFTQAEALDSLPSETATQGADRMAEIIRRRVVSGGLSFRLVQFTHGA